MSLLQEMPYLMSLFHNLLYFQIPIKSSKMRVQIFGHELWERWVTQNNSSGIFEITRLFKNQFKFLQQSHSSCCKGSSFSEFCKFLQRQWERVDPGLFTWLPSAVSLCRQKEMEIKAGTQMLLLQTSLLPQLFFSSDSAITQNHPSIKYQLSSTV